MGRLQIGIIGAGRSKQGLGPYIARSLRDAGTDVTAISCATDKGLHEAQRLLQTEYGIDVRGYLSASDLLHQETLDAVVIASPTATHGEYLELALATGLHTLCEKPFVYDCPDPVRLTRRIVAGFQDRHRVLLENVQWPYVLSAFHELHPDAFGPGRPVRDFSMLLCPAGKGIHMLVESLSHFISLLQAIVPGGPGEVEKVEFYPHDPNATRLVVRFDYVTSSDRVAVTVELRQELHPPRSAFIAINGCKAERFIRPHDYSMMLTDRDRTVALPDPMSALLRDFVYAVEATRSGKPARVDSSIVSRMELFHRIVEAF
jgi:hypothetical protein